MKKSLSLLIAIVLLAAIGIKGFSQEDDTTATTKKQYPVAGLWGIGVKATTDGFGIEVVKGFGARLNIRLGYSFMKIPFSYPLEMEGLSATVEANLKFGGANLFLDFYPVKNSFHLTAGVMQNGMKHTVSLTPTSEFPYGDIMVPASELGIVEAVITPKLKFSPYVAVGFGNTLSREHRVSLNFELGALYHGAPQLDLVGTNMLSPMASENNEQVIMDAIAQYQWYPMMSLQLTFRII
ncbi:MAG: hypothetical protein V2A67_05225 [Bacteroidota bacterium]